MLLSHFLSRPSWRANAGANAGAGGCAAVAPAADQGIGAADVAQLVRVCHFLRAAPTLLRVGGLRAVAEPLEHAVARDLVGDRRAVPLLTLARRRSVVAVALRGLLVRRGEAGRVGRVHTDRDAVLQPMGTVHGAARGGAGAVATCRWVSRMSQQGESAGSVSR